MLPILTELEILGTLRGGRLPEVKTLCLKGLSNLDTFLYHYELHTLQCPIFRVIETFSLERLYLRFQGPCSQSGSGFVLIYALSTADSRSTFYIKSARWDHKLAESLQLTFLKCQSVYLCYRNLDQRFPFMLSDSHFTHLDMKSSGRYKIDGGWVRNRETNSDHYFPQCYDGHDGEMATYC